MTNEEKMFLNTMMTGFVQPKPVAQLYELYITGEIEEASNYIPWFDMIRHADEMDIIKIYINSYGGDLFTAIQFMRVLAETRASIICSVEGACMSAATMIFLSCDQFEVTPHSVFMFHNYSGGTIGKGGEMIDQLLHERRWSESLMKNIYKDFLTEEEIENMLNNRDYWMDGNEVVARLNNRIKIRTEQAEEQAEKDLKEALKETKNTARATRPAVNKPAPKTAPAKKPATKNTKK